MFGYLPSDLEKVQRAFELRGSTESEWSNFLVLVSAVVTFMCARDAVAHMLPCCQCGIREDLVTTQTKRKRRHSRAWVIAFLALHEQARLTLFRTAEMNDTMRLDLAHVRAFFEEEDQKIVNVRVHYRGWFFVRYRGYFVVGSS